MKTTLILFVAAALALLLSGCALFRLLPVPYENIAVETREPLPYTPEPVHPQISTSTPLDPMDVPVLTTREISREGDSPRYIIQVRYPQIESYHRQDNLFNFFIERAMEDFVSSFIAELPALPTEDDLEDLTNGLTADYRTTYIDSKQISINFLQSVYFAGAAHPLPFSRTINYDLRWDRTLELEELFTPGTPYLERISEFALDDLRRQGVLEWEEGAAPSAENYDSWNVTLEGLLFTFDPYQVAPYAAGFQEVLIPYGILSEILRQDGPVPPLDYP